MGLFGNKSRKGRESHTEHDDPEEDSRGWDAITAAMEARYPGAELRHVGYVPGLHLGSGLQGCSAYEAPGHWHYVTYGLTELWGKEEDSDPEFSGWGFELTIRVARRTGETEPPAWPFTLVEHVAKFVREQGVLLADGHRMDTLNPITGEPGTALTVLAFTPDPELPALDTPNGRVEFLQIVGVTAAELATMKETSTVEVLADLATGNPLLITDPSRAT